ncbi:DUF551 domain-containing protein [Enterobacter cloacae complex sp. 2024EL-00719]|uniref:DUF551 domain-containing protein n=1 Tax=unclassified Enterobacter cloacae complex TaxID=2757714 RepID=UPI003291443E
MKQKFIEWFTKNNNGCSPAMEDDRSFVYEMTQHMFEAYQAGVAEGEAKCAALASIEAEPVAWLLSGGGAKNHVSFDSGNAYADPLREVTPLYAAPQLPQPAVPETVPESLKDKLLTICDLVEDNDEYCQDIWNACRADMLQGSDGNSQVIPDGWIPVSERMPGSQEWVIVFAKWDNQQVLCWDDVANRWTDFEDQSYYADMFTHWMPLPAAPQQEVNNG